MFCCIWQHLYEMFHQFITYCISKWLILEQIQAMYIGFQNVKFLNMYTCTPKFWICQRIFILNECFQFSSTSWFWSSIKGREVIHLSSLFICIISWNLKTELREVQTCFLNKNVSSLIGFMIKKKICLIQFRICRC